MSNVPINGSSHSPQATSEFSWKGAQALGRVHALNERCLELLTQLARTDRQQISLAIVNQHRSLWRGLSATARKRAACTPFLLVDLHFQDADWWRSAKDPRPSRRRKTVLHAAFTGKIAGELMRETLMLAWSTVAFDRGAASIMLGMTPAVSGIIAELGGTLTWSGDPLNAQIDIRASHLVETSPIDLISSQTTDQDMLNSYRQRLPFYVYLDLKGQLLAPLISFKIDMPPDKQSAFGGAIYAKILDINTRESDVNKQVFALLILRRFISENPLESQGSDVANTTRTSVSRLLSDQLNRLSENVKGVQLSLDIKSYEDYSTGEAQGNTQVQLGVSKSLLNDRLVVKLSGNVAVEGENTTQNDASDYIGDLALEYKLTTDGRFRITGFRTSNYDMIDGELTETGVGFLYIKDYNTLKELFKANENPK